MRERCTRALSCRTRCVDGNVSRSGAWKWKEVDEGQSCGRSRDDVRMKVL